ncbi:MAG: DNA polymerase/3'-5' exonuclease PolX [Calditrichaeota bacterium]|nr:DNA polymerase/3'-5' exonuclease PolX [Calditrichota bacterium]
MEKKQIAEILREMAVLMELKGENPFKVRAYENASRIIEGLSEDLTELVQTGRILSIKGIGSGIAEKIQKLIETGHLPEYEELKQAIPEGLIEMLKIQGMGPKKIKAVWEKLGITTVGELEYACRENRLVDLPGFGRKTQEKILQGIEMLKKFKERHLISEALAEAEILYEAIRDFPGVIRSQIAGSLRRWKETIKDIDILVSAEDKDRMAIMNHFTALPTVETVTAKGETKSSVVLKSGINADLRIVSDAQFPYALHHFTGSKEHNIAMREYANSLGLKMNEYGLFRGQENIPCRDEAEIFHALGMDFIPPEMRENFGEIEAALAHQIPRLIEMDDLRGMIHVHSNYSDGVNSIEDLARACQQMGFEYLVLCDHSKATYYANGLDEERVKQQHAEIDAVNARLDGFRILKGTECDILPDGSLDYSDDVLATFDIVIVSIHSRFNMTEAEATERLIRAMENPYVTILGHPTGRLLLGRDGYPVDLVRVIDAAAELGVAIELNANPHRLDLDWRYCKYAREKGVKIAIGPDAHRIEGLADVRYGVGVARKGWLRKEDVLNTFSAEELLAFARKRRP